MALMKCKACGKEVSNKAEKCVHCGAPTKRATLGCGTVIAALILLPVIFVSFQSIFNPEKPLPKQSSIKTFYQGDNWTVFELRMTDETKECELRSAPHYLDSGKNPKYGSTLLKVNYPINNVTFYGENILAYFKIAKLVTFHIDDDSGIMIIPEVPISGDRVVDKMMQGDTVKIKLDFETDGEPSFHIFSLSGFPEAYQNLRDCATIHHSILIN